MSKVQFLKDNMQPGEVYAGLILGQDGEQDYHLFICPGDVVDVTWDQAKKWAKKIAGGELPTRKEQRVLFANTQPHFKPTWYWSSEQRDSGSDYAWTQSFSHGFQYHGHKVSTYRARAVRRLPI